MQLKDQPSLGAAAQNIGIVCQLEGEAARNRGDEPTALRHFEEARCSVEESLRVKQSYNNKPEEALAWSQLARIYLLLGDLAVAERHAHEARQIREPLGLKEAWMDCHTLSEIAQARGDLATAINWAKKRDGLLAELKRRAGGSALPAQMLKALQSMAPACARVGLGAGDFGPIEEKALAQIDGLPAPFPELAAFLRQIAAGGLPPIPGGLPGELGEWQ